MSTADEMQQFYSALKNGEVEEIKRLVSASPELVVSGLFSGSALHFAASEGNLISLKALIEVGQDINHPIGDFGTTPLCRAANGESDNPIEVIQWMLAHGADPKLGGVLVSAVTGGSKEVVELLLAAGADPTTRTGNPPRNAYEQALRLGKTELAALLAQKNKDFNITTYLSSQFGELYNSEPREIPFNAPFTLRQFIGPDSVVVCTVGLSAYDSGLPYRCELMVRLPLNWPDTDAIGQDVQWPVDFLLDIALTALKAPILQTFHTIGNGEPPQRLSKDVLFCGVVLVPENYEDMPFDGNGNVIKVFSLQPIYAEEIALAKAGIEKLVKAFDKAGLSPKSTIGKTRTNLAKSWWKR